jgi:hypothetical protein
MFQSWQTIKLCLFIYETNNNGWNSWKQHEREWQKGLIGKFLSHTRSSKACMTVFRKFLCFLFIFFTREIHERWEVTRDEHWKVRLSILMFVDSTSSAGTNIFKAMLKLKMTCFGQIFFNGFCFCETLCCFTFFLFY